MNQISLASLMMSLHMNKGELDDEMVRHMILNSVRGYRTMYNEDYGELVLTYDSRGITECLLRRNFLSLSNFVVVVFPNISLDFW